MKKNFTFFLILSVIIVLQPGCDDKTRKTILVTPDNFIGFGWEKDQVNSMKPASPTPGCPTCPVCPAAPNTYTNYVSIVCGPVNSTSPDLSQGSVLIRLPKNEDSTLKRVRLRNNQYNGTFLSDITTLNYSTYIESTINFASPVLALQIDIDGNADVDCNIYFDPRKQTRPPTKTGPGLPVKINVWQEWNCLIDTWELLITSTTSVSVSGKFTGIKNFSLATFIKAFPKARIINTITGDNAGGGIRFTVGGSSSDYDNFKGYIDAFEITTPFVCRCTTFPCVPAGDILYDFSCPKQVTNTIK